MAVNTTGKLELRGDGTAGEGIGLEVYGNVTGSNISLAQVSITAEFTAPHSMGEFYGYTSNSPATSVYLRDNYGQTTNPNQSPCGGHTITWTCHVVDDDTTNANYKWYRNGTLVQNGSSNTYATSASSTTYAIYCKYTDQGGLSVDSNTFNQTWQGSQISTYRAGYPASSPNHGHSSANCGAFPGGHWGNAPGWDYYNSGPAAIPSGQVHASTGISGFSPGPSCNGQTSNYAGSANPGSRANAPGLGGWFNPTSTHVSQRASMNLGIGGGGCSYVKTANQGVTQIGLNQD